MTWLLESPLTIVAVGGLLVAVLVVMWQQNDERKLLYAAGAALLATLGMVGVERYVVTESEELTAAVHAIEAALEANDPVALTACLSPGVPELGDEARRALKVVHVTGVVITDLKLAFGSPLPAGEASARFEGTIRGMARDPSQKEANGLVEQKFVLYFRREPAPAGPWKLFRYERTNRDGSPGIELPGSW